jgi:ATP-dependent Clp protease ATP-binding subunit ClpC
MNETILTHLKILVERAVRPVRASIARKRKMREELLAHVSAVFEEEIKSGDDTAALARTEQRFGVPSELTRQLQSTVPAADRVNYCIETFAGVPTRESALRRGARYAGTIGVACAIFLAFWIPLVGRSEDWLSLPRLPSLLAPAFMAFLTFCATLLEASMRRALFDPRGRNWPRAVATGIATWLLVPTSVLAWYLAMGGDIAAIFREVQVLFVSSLLAPVALLIVVYACITEIRYLEEWASLRID